MGVAEPCRDRDRRTRRQALHHIRKSAVRESWRQSHRAKLPVSEKVAARLMLSAIPILGRIRNDRFFLDLRTIDPAEDGIVLAALRGLAGAV